MRIPEESRGQIPYAARAKLLTMQGMSNDARDAAASAQTRIRNLQEQTHSSTLTDAQSSGITQEIERLQAARAKQNERHAVLLTLVDNLRRYIQAVPNSISLELVKHVPPKRLDGENLGDALARIRDEISAVKHHRHAVATATVPKSAMKEAAKRYVEQMAKQGKPHVAGEGDGIRVTYGSAKSFVPQGVRAAAELFCWLDPAAVLKRLEAEIDALPTPSNAMNADERERRIIDLLADLERLEREEESLIEQAADDGIEVLRRPEASPAAVLGVRIKTRPIRVRVA